jgi:hypothetical protein
MNFDKRIRALEAQLIADRVVLHFPDSSTRELDGPRYFLLSLFSGACGGGDLSPEETVKLDLIRKSVSAEEPGGGHMVDLIRCFLLGQLKEPSSVTPVPS